MSKRLTLFALIVVSCMAILSKPVYAHVLIGDEGKSIGTVLHVSPDDDPIAGQPATLFFDLQSHKAAQNGTSLIITDDSDNQVANVPLKIEGSFVTAEYTFPAQGVYGLKLVVNSSKVYTFDYSQRVSRGIAGSALDKPSYPLANLLLVACGTAALILLILGFNHRQAIRKQSKF